MRAIVNLLKAVTFISAAAFILTSCTKGPGPNPPAPTASFTNLVVNGLCNVKLVPGAANKLDSVSGALVSQVVNNTLYINGAGSAIITVKDLDTLITDGATYTRSTAALNLDHVVVVGNGYSKMNLNLNATDSIVAVSNGVGPYEYSGTTPKLHVYANGLGEFKGFNLLTNDCVVGLAGVGISEVYASSSLKVFIAGAGTVYYKGNPAKVDTIFIAGIGRVIPK